VYTNPSTGCSTGCMNSTCLIHATIATSNRSRRVNIIQPVVQPVWQPVVSCKRGIRNLRVGPSCADKEIRVEHLNYHPDTLNKLAAAWNKVPVNAAPVPIVCHWPWSWRKQIRRVCSERNGVDVCAKNRDTLRSGTLKMWGVQILPVIFGRCWNGHKSRGTGDECPQNLESGTLV